jgi:hypothetical protein
MSGKGRIRPREENTESMGKYNISTRRKMELEIDYKALTTH